MSTAPKRGRGRPAAQLSVPWLRIEPDGHADLARYDDAATMDMGDWLINLEVRAVIARAGDADLIRFVRENPIIRRSDAHACGPARSAVQRLSRPHPACGACFASIFRLI